MKIRILLIAAIVCSGVTGAAVAERITETGNVPWTYDGEKNSQDYWGVLSTAYAACELGTRQSPVHIAYTTSSFKPPLDIRYKPAKATARHDGHMVVVDIREPLVLSSEAQEYVLKNITLHSPAEHTAQEDFYALEIELLHEDKDGNRLMLSIFGDLGDQPNAALESILAKTPPPGGPSADIVFDLAGLLPDKRGYFAYEGSLTFPPCTEGIQWRIFKEPISISREQLAKVGELVGRNARLTQPVYTRTIEETNR